MAATNGTKALVIGGGIGGLSAALALRRLGMQVEVFEAQPRLREVGSGLTLWTNAIRALDKLGAAEQVIASGAVVQRLENRSWQGRLLATLPISAIEEKYGAPCVGIHRGTLQNVLADALDVPVSLGKRLTRFDQDGQGVTAHFTDGEQARAHLLVGADGIGSAVRSQLLGGGPTRYSGYTCWRSAVKPAEALLPAGTYVQAYGPGMTFGLFPIGGGAYSWYGTVMTPENGDLETPAERKREARRHFDGWYAPLVEAIDGTHERDIVRGDIADRRPIPSWGEGRVTLLGDAAHPTTPTLGQGGCMAIEDAVVLARSLSLGGGVGHALRYYASQRTGRTGGIVRQARRHGVFYHASNALVGAARDSFFRFAPVSVAMREVDKLMGYEA